MPSIIAALGISQLKKVDKLIEIRRNNSKYMTKALSGIKDIIIPGFPKEVFHVYQEYPIRITAGGKRTILLWDIWLFTQIKHLFGPKDYVKSPFIELLYTNSLCCS